MIWITIFLSFDAPPLAFEWSRRTLRVVSVALARLWLAHSCVIQPAERLRRGPHCQKYRDFRSLFQ